MMKRRNFLKAIGLGAVVAPAVVKASEGPRFKHEEYSLPLELDHSALPEYNPKPYIVQKGHYISSLSPSHNSNDTYEVMVDGVNLVEIDIPKQITLGNLKLRDF